MPYKNKEKQKEYQKEYRQKNKEKIQGYYQKNKEKIKEKSKRWKERNPNKVKEYRRRRREKDRQYSLLWRKNHLERFRFLDSKSKRKSRQTTEGHLNSTMGTALRCALKDKKAGRHWEVLVGYSLVDLIKHLEHQWDDKMDWENYGSYWWIDHILPSSKFHFKSIQDPEFLKCWALKNLRPLEKIANIKKGNR